MTHTQAYRLLSLLCLLWVAGCSTTPQTSQIEQTKASFKSTKTVLNEVPFYDQTEFFCGPTTLSETFAYYGKQVDIDTLASNVFIPGKQGSLQLEMVSASRKHGFLAYSKRGSMKELIDMLDAEIPVIVFQNNGLSWAPSWHYAVVVGYDLSSMEFILHSGNTQHHRLHMSVFERTWRRADYWLLAPLPIGLTHSALDAHVYIQAAYNLLETGNQQTALANLRAATEQWPQEWLSYFLIANHYATTDKPKALAWYLDGLENGVASPEYLNNMGHLLWELECQEQSQATLEFALQRFPSSVILHDTLQETAKPKTLIADNNAKAGTSVRCPVIAL